MCFSPALLPFYNIENKAVVVIDIFRASSAICTAMAYGVKEIIPVCELEEAQQYKAKGYIVAAERRGEIVDGFTIGNSPQAFKNEKLINKTVVLTTTNCTTAIHKAATAKKVYIASFLNISAMANHLKTIDEDVILLCAGWKNRYNLEDSVFAGALAQKLAQFLNVECDGALASMHLYDYAKKDLRAYLRNSSHSRRLEHLHIEEDIMFCLQADIFDVVPQFNGLSVTPIKL